MSALRFDGKVVVVNDLGVPISDTDGVDAAPARTLVTELLL